MGQHRALRHLAVPHRRQRRRPAVLLRCGAAAGWPAAAPRKAARAFLDPPYWRQAAGRYSSEPGELAEMDLDAFYASWWKITEACMGHADRIAYIISPTQNDDGTVGVPHARFGD